MSLVSKTDKTKLATRYVGKNSSSLTLPPQSRASATGAALGKPQTVISVSKARGERWAMRVRLNKDSTLERLRACGRRPTCSHVGLKASEGGAAAGYTGLETCGSVWACPVCSAKVARRRKEEVGLLVDVAQERDLVVSMLTLTQRHHQGQRLEMLWESLSYAWNRLTSLRRWKELRQQLGIVGYIRATEVTHGKAGWHVHTHVLILSEKNPNTTPLYFQRKQGRKKTPYPVEVMVAADFIAERWAKALAAKKVDFIKDLGGLDWQIARDAEAMGSYVAKMGGAGGGGLAAETTLGLFKKAKRGNRTPFQIFEDYMKSGEKRQDSADFGLWAEWERVSKGKRALVWSRGLRDWGEIGEEKTDEEIAAEDVGGDVLLLFDYSNWKRVYEAGSRKLLDAVEEGGLPLAISWLRKRGIRFIIPPGPDKNGGGGSGGPKNPDL